ncbi:MAG: OsmC family protein [Chloroflexi bacterium]|nr:OsmC family protein [Chloroflexota bacterium]
MADTQEKVTHAIAIDLQNPDGGMHFIADTGDGVAVHIDSDEAVGGQGLGARPQKLLLVSLASCSGMDVISILRKKRQTVTGLRVEARGEKADNHPKVYTHIWLDFHVTGSEVDPKAVERAIELSMTRYCPVAGMLHEVVDIDTNYTITEG